MRSESEVRTHRDNLLKVIDIPCTCKGSDKFACMARKHWQKQAVEHCNWFLGEESQQIEDVAKAANAATAC